MPILPDDPTELSPLATEPNHAPAAEPDLHCYYMVTGLPYQLDVYGAVSAMSDLLRLGAVSVTATRYIIDKNAPAEPEAPVGVNEPAHMEDDLL